MVTPAHDLSPTRAASGRPRSGPKRLSHPARDVARATNRAAPRQAGEDRARNDHGRRARAASGILAPPARNRSEHRNEAAQSPVSETAPRGRLGLHEHYRSSRRDIRDDQLAPRRAASNRRAHDQRTADPVPDLQRRAQAALHVARRRDQPRTACGRAQERRLRQQPQRLQPDAPAGDALRGRGGARSSAKPHHRRDDHRPGRGRDTIPVSCVEHGRWDSSRPAERFVPAPQAAYPELRRAKEPPGESRVAARADAAPIRARCGSAVRQSVRWRSIPRPARCTTFREPTGGSREVGRRPASCSRASPARSSRRRADRPCSSLALESTPPCMRRSSRATRSTRSPTAKKQAGRATEHGRGRGDSSSLVLRQPGQSAEPAVGLGDGLRV